jgi:hypothetical protein
MKRLLRFAWLGEAVLAAAIVVGGTAPSALAHAGSHDCKDIAKDTSKACQNSASESYWLAIARCDNAPGQDKKGACPKAAAKDQKDAKGECKDQLDARLDICKQLGGGKYSPPIVPADFSTTIDNPLFPLKPGTTFHYEGDTASGHEIDTFEVTHDTRTLMGVTCVAVHDSSTLDGVLSEDTIDWFAQDAAGNVWYFGEDSRQYEDGFLVGIEGSWQAGVDDALPGIVMEAAPMAGDVYRQEFAIGAAEDMADVVALGQSASVPFGSFTNALETHEFSGLEPSANERKYYVPNVGFVLSIDDEAGGERLELVSITTE